MLITVLNCLRYSVVLRGAERLMVRLGYLKYLTLMVLRIGASGKVFLRQGQAKK